MKTSSQNHFISSISHELKNQLAGILSLSEMIKDEFFGQFGDERYKKEYLEAAADINNVANDMLEFVNDLMDAQDNQGEYFTINKEEVDIDSLIKRVIRVNQPYALSKNINIVFDDNQNVMLNEVKHLVKSEEILRCTQDDRNNAQDDRNNVQDDNSNTQDDNLLQIFLDPKRTKQILTNLISNSIKYSPRNTTITISTRIIEESQTANNKTTADNKTINNRTANNKKLIIFICDQGIGMSKEQIKMALDGKGAQIDKSVLENITEDDVLENHHYQTHTTQEPITQEQTQSHEQTQHHKQACTTNQTRSQEKTQCKTYLQNNLQTHNLAYNQLLFNSHGIGMPLVKQLVEAQNGTMEIISELGFGTKVVLGFGIS
jgi:signal transduction histidine kinase